MAVVNFANKNWQSELDAATQAKKNAEKALSNLGTFNYARQGSYDEAINQILNRKDFSFDMNSDALYNQYKNNYMQQGKLAMQNAMGQASAMTGGYGNSYAQSVGQQTYQNYMDKLNDVIPTLYQLALSKYNLEGDALNSKFGVLSSDRSSKYSEFADKYSRLATERDYYGNNYNNVFNAAYQAAADAQKSSGSGGGSGSGGRRSSGRRRKSSGSSKSGSAKATTSTTVNNAPYGIPAKEVINSGVGPVSGKGLADAIARGIIGVSPGGAIKKSAGLPAYDSIEALKHIW